LKRAFGQQLIEMRRKVEKERDAKTDAFEKLESMRLEMKALEGKDMKNDLWKDKCKELYEMCRELEMENDKLRDSYTLTNQHLTETKAQLMTSL
jgi:hypothetical protein